MRMLDGESGRCLLARVQIAESFTERLMGLMSRRGLEAGTGMLLPRCSSIHMFFMRFAIDLVYLDASRGVKRVVAGVKPWRVSWCLGADAVLEAPAGWAGAAGLSEGMQVVFEDAAESA
jgi:hypothetical protein